jgi:hypothetical protein
MHGKNNFKVLIIVFVMWNFFLFTVFSSL